MDRYSKESCISKGGRPGADTVGGVGGRGCGWYVWGRTASVSWRAVTVVTTPSPVLPCGPCTADFGLDERAFSIVGKPGKKSLHLVASTAEECAFWFEGLQGLVRPDA